MARELNDRYRELAEVLRANKIELAATHIAGKENVLADAISRWERPYDDQDWLLSRDAFKVVNGMTGPFEVDACADVAGYNSQCPHFWSQADDCLKQRWAGKNVYCNPPFDNAMEIIRHFLQQWAASPQNTEATFVLPQWTWAPWWRFSKYFDTIHTFQQGEHLFTSPNWNSIARGGPPDSRCDRGPTRWPVVVWHKAKAPSAGV